MKVFLTGATGYVGGAVADRLREAGHSVEGLARSDQAAQVLEAKGLRVRRGSIEQLAILREAAAEADAVVHAWGGRDVDAFRERDLPATRALLGALEGTGKPFVYVSGSLGTGDTGPDLVVDELTPDNPPSFLAWRAELEREVLAAAARAVRSVVIRAPMIYGRGSGFMALSLRQQAREAGVVHHVGSGENLLAFLHVEDLADLFALALERAPAGSLYVAAGDDVLTYRELARLAADTFGGATAPLPVSVARQMLGPFADALTYSQRLSSAKAKRELGWAPRRHGIAEELRTMATA